MPFPLWYVDASGSGFMNLLSGAFGSICILIFFIYTLIFQKVYIHPTATHGQCWSGNSMPMAFSECNQLGTIEVMGLVTASDGNRESTART